MTSEGHLPIRDARQIIQQTSALVCGGRGAAGEGCFRGQRSARQGRSSSQPAPSVVLTAYHSAARRLANCASKLGRSQVADRCGRGNFPGASDLALCQISLVRPAGQQSAHPMVSAYQSRGAPRRDHPGDPSHTRRRGGDDDAGDDAVLLVLCGMDRT